MTRWNHLRLLWGLRVTLARGRLLRGNAIIPTLAGTSALAAVTIAACRETCLILTSAPVQHDPLLGRFLLLLIGFLASTMWIAWPVVTASIDDAAELSRFALFPVSSQRLFFTSVLAGLVEPRALPLWGALVGADAALCLRGTHFLIAIPATIVLTLCSVIWGRVGLHALLNVLRHRRSAEAMGAGLLVLLGCAAFVPPPDLSWLRSLNTATPKVNDALLRGAIDLFTLLPTGGWASALYADQQGYSVYAAFALSYMLVATVVGYFIAFWLLERFHRRAGRGLPQRVETNQERMSFSFKSLDWVLVERELRDCWLNPRTRLTLALPFFLAILLKLVGAHALAVELAGPKADACLIGGLASYGAFVLAAGFAQNCFGYDGGGAQVFLGSPLSMQKVVRAKNVVHGGLAMLLCAALIVFYSLYIALPSPVTIVLVLSNAVFQVLLFLAVGNLLSVLTPRKFHPSLKRRDRVTAFAMAGGLAAAWVGVLPGLTLIRSTRADRWPPYGVAVILLLPLLGWVLWKISVPLSLYFLERRRPELIKALARE